MLNPFVIVGLGNIGSRYDFTRHNIGFDILDDLCSMFDCVGNSLKFNGEYKTVSYILKGDNLKGYLIKPHTFMNLSGECVRPFLDYYKIPFTKVLVIHDDVDLKPGCIKFKCGGGDAGHNGLKSITSHLGTNNYYRLRIGVGRPANSSYEMKDWVLGRFSSDERSLISKVTEEIKSNFNLFLSEDFKRFQEKINSVKLI